MITINTTYRVDVPTQYGTFAVGIITATVQNINAGMNTKTIVTPNWARWSGTIDVACLLRS